eukprot:9498067-Pyramimonas_sp.AAC.1
MKVATGRREREAERRKSRRARASPPAKALAAFYAQQCKMHEDIGAKLADFRARRNNLRTFVTPRPIFLGRILEG